MKLNKRTTTRTRIVENVNKSRKIREWLETETIRYLIGFSLKESRVLSLPLSSLSLLYRQKNERKKERIRSSKSALLFLNYDYRASALVEFLNNKRKMNY